MIDNKVMFQEITFEILKNTQIGDRLSMAMATLQKAQEVAYAYVTDESSDGLKMMRIGSAIAFSIVSKIAAGKPISEFSEQDWIEVSSNVADYAILAGGQSWSIIVFSIYANYVDISANVLEKRGILKEKCDAIRMLATEVRSLEKELVAGIISETEYTEQCLWLLLEAMVKLLATYTTVWVGEDYSEFIQGLAAFAFEYGRYSLYKREQEILAEYIQHQSDVDVELQDKLDEFNLCLKERQQEFMNIISDAFSPDVMQRFKTSVIVARKAGVSNNEIISTIDEIDDYFC